MDASYRFGIEEEFFLADAATRGTPRRTVKAFHAAVRTRLPTVERELLQSQVEVASPPATDFAEARGVLAGLRAGLAEVELSQPGTVARCPGAARLLSAAEFGHGGAALRGHRGVGYERRSKPVRGRRSRSRAVRGDRR